jgi:hypothetical protein
MHGTRPFTVASAQRTLPLVKRIVADILSAAEKLRSPDAKRNDAETRRLVAQVESHMRELEQIGCQYKDWDFKIGLVDFPTVINGEDVLLCWRSDEPEIRWYHTYNGGYAGRRQIPEGLL